MSSGRYNRANTADRYRQIAAEYAGLSKDTTDPFLRPYYLRIAEGYTVRADGELQAWERQRITGPNPARTCDLQGPAMKNTKAFLLGFGAAWAPILIYTAWITWRIAEAI
jgi:hypothetical protein